MLNILLFPAFASASSEGQKVILPTSYRLLKFKMRNSSHEDVAREVLLSLGVPEGIANGMQNSETLEDVYNASDLNSYTEYSKIKPDGTDITISKAQCLKEVASLQRSATTLNDNNAYNENTDKYFKKTILAIWVAEANGYLYWTCFEWITDPFFRSRDVCGIYATDGYVQQNGGMAAFSYDVYLNNTLDSKYYREYHQDNVNDSAFFTEDLRTLTFDFNLPINYHPIAYRNFAIAVIYSGKPTNTKEEFNYNIYGKYYHRYYWLKPSFSIDILGNGVGFSVTPENEYKSYSINCSINYTP